MTLVLPERIVALPSGPDGTPIDKSLRLFGTDLPAPADDGFHRPFSPKDIPASEPTKAMAQPAVVAGPAKPKREKAKAEFIGERARGIAYDLEHPLRVGDVEYHSTRICSPAGSKFGEFQALREEFDAADLLLWLTCDLPIEVVEVLSFEDKLELEDRGRPFLPRRIRAAMDAAEVTETEAATETTP